MHSLQEAVGEYRAQLARGAVKRAYQGIMEYVLALRAHLKNRYPQYSVSGSLYYGYMDMTYFSIFPPALKERGLKIAVVLLHDTCRFEAWLSAVNKQVQTEYWRRVKESGWGQYRLVPSPKGYDSIIEHALAEDPNFDDLDGLTAQIERELLAFIQDVEGFLASQP